MFVITVPKRYLDDRLIALGYCLRWCRKASGNRQADMARLLGVSHKTISAYETGRRLPDVFVINTYAYEAGVAVDDILHSIGLETAKTIEWVYASETNPPYEDWPPLPR